MPFGQPSSTHGSDISFELSEETACKIASLQAKLNLKLGPEYLSQRPGPGGGPKLTYIEGWKVINIANEVFGFNGWSSSVMNLTTDYIDYNENSQRYSIGATAIVRVTLRDGVFHEDVGYGAIENAKQKGAALDKCKKEAVTDAVKRALRSFGNLLGNCIYDKTWIGEVMKIKVPPVKFDKDELWRRPEVVTYEQKNLAQKSNVPSMGPPAGGLITPMTTPQQPKKVTFNQPPQPAPPLIRPPLRPPNPSAPQPVNALNPPIPARPAVPSIPTPIPAAPVRPPPVTEFEEESFTFYSDDDAILAAVDACDLEADVGPPIHYSLTEADSELTPLHDQEQSAPQQPQHQPQQPKQPIIPQAPSASSSRQPIFQHPPARHSPNIPVQHSMQQHTPYPGPSRPPLLPVQQAPGPAMAPPRQPLPRQEKQPPLTTEHSSTPAPRRGGFAFPPGMDIHNVNNSGRTPLATLPQDGSGVKRKADEMASSSGPRKMGPGMGLMSSIASNQNVNLQADKRVKR